MSSNSSTVQSLRRVFRDNFSTYDITESLISCDLNADATEISEFMSQRKLEVIGVRKEGLVVGYVERSSLGQGECGNYLQEFDQSHVVLDSMPFAELVIRLDSIPRLFVSVFGRIGGIVTRSDLQKPPVRMWLFGMITLIEMRLTRMIEEAAGQGALGQEDWRQYLSDERLRKAEVLMAERVRRNQQLGLLDCLQFSDKCQIVARNKTLRMRTRFESRRRFEEAAKKLERLRNNLAHTQDIISTDWDALVDISRNLDELVDPSQREVDPSNENRTSRADVSAYRITQAIAATISTA